MRQKEARAVSDDTLTFSIIIQQLIMPNATSTSLWQTESRTKDHANLQYQSSAIRVGDSGPGLQHCLRKRKQPRQPDVDQLGPNQFGIHEGFRNKRFPLGDARQRAPQASVSTHPVSLFPIHRTKGMQTTAISSPGSLKTEYRASVCRIIAIINCTGYIQC
ncbi:hypothetical protein GQ607_016697 [Colletotrichum asianum]|uniref:Uncharacterized protein n=1 Tax=Colletotrichum asianum TaxID=702518 RepID=A0A8H3W0J3_9PEZI|nr:hypothetical protein GQ607_016697 [Colletotrichum asianum]